MIKTYTSLPQPPDPMIPRICTPAFAEASAGKCVYTVGFHKLKPALLFLVLMAAFQLPGIYGQGETDSCILASPAIYGEYHDN